MLPPGLQTPREVTLYYDSLYDSLITSGSAVPFVYPWAGIGAFTVLTYLLINHRDRPVLRWLRYPIFAFVFAFQAWSVLTNRARHPAGAFGVGLLSAWGTMWVSTIMVVNDCQSDFVRIEERSAGSGDGKAQTNGSVSNGSSKLDAVDQSHPQSTLFWQEYPTRFLDRLDWISDVFCSFRGVGWNWQTSTVPPLPKTIELQLLGKDDQTESKQSSSVRTPESQTSTKHESTVTASKVGIRRFTQSDPLLRTCLTNLVIGYLSLDLIITIMHHDPYFWGYTDAPPPIYLPTYLQASHSLTKSYRLLVSLAGISVALGEIFQLGPAFFCGLLGPRWIGLRGTAWMNPLDMFGSFSCVLDDGLAGWWGGWWHQVFRVGFQAHSTWVLGVLGIEKRSRRGQLISLVVAFVLSGCLHACGSYTQLGDTRPFMGPMRFFLLQPVGIVAQLLLAKQLANAGITQRVPRFCKRLANFIIVHAWLYFTAPLLVDDFAKGGVWLFEPIAFSPLRLLGLGAKDDGFFCWWDGIVFWRSGEHWWDTGFAV